MSVKKSDQQDNTGNVESFRPSRQEAENAVRTLLRWIGENPNREGLQDTPKRVIKAYEEYFAGYETDPADILSRTFEEVEGYDEIVMLRDIPFHSHCEHHMAPIEGRAHIAYLPTGRVVGISKLARIVDAYARRLQTQETMTAQIANAIEEVLQPRGVAVIIDATHGCMTRRGVKKSDARMVTAETRGAFDFDDKQRRKLFDLINAPGLSSGLSSQCC